MGDYIHWKKKKYFKIFEEEDREGYLFTVDETRRAVKRYNRYDTE